MACVVILDSTVTANGSVMARVGWHGRRDWGSRLSVIEATERPWHKVEEKLIYMRQLRDKGDLVGLIRQTVVAFEVTKLSKRGGSRLMSQGQRQSRDGNINVEKRDKLLRAKKDI